MWFAAWQYNTFPRKTLYYVYSMKLKRTTWWRRGSLVAKCLYSTSAYEAKSFCEVSNLSKRALQSFVKARPCRFVNSFNMGIFHENAIWNLNQGVIKLPFLGGIKQCKWNGGDGKCSHFSWDDNRFDFKVQQLGAVVGAGSASWSTSTFWSAESSRGVESTKKTHHFRLFRNWRDVMDVC